MVIARAAGGERLFGEGEADHGEPTESGNRYLFLVHLPSLEYSIISVIAAEPS